MANRDHVEILRQGRSMWYQWHIRHPDEKLDLQGAYLSEVDIGSIDLRGVDLSKAHLDQVKFDYTDLREANLSGARIRNCQFTNSSLSGANFNSSDLFHTTFHDVDLRQANFEGCFFGCNVFAHLDLSMTKGLEKTTHYAASSLSFDSLIRSNGKIADNFLWGCGISDNLIRTLPSFMQEATEYHTCLLMYYDLDRIIVGHLHDRLQAAGVRCWLYERGDSHGNKDRQITHLLASESYDKIIICCSQNVFKSMWLSNEITRTETLENIYEDQRLMSLDLDGCMVPPSDGRKSMNVMQERLIQPFQDWNSEANFEVLVQEVVNALRRKRV